MVNKDVYTGLPVCTWKRLWFVSPWLTHRHTGTHINSFWPVILLAQPAELKIARPANRTNTLARFTLCRLQHSRMYTVSHKKTCCRTFYDNFINC